MAMYDAATDATVQMVSEEQIRLPDEVQLLLGNPANGKFALIAESGMVRIMNPSMYAMGQLQKEMRGAADAAGLGSDEAIAEWITESRRERRKNGTW